VSFVVNCILWHFVPFVADDRILERAWRPALLGSAVSLRIARHRRARAQTATIRIAEGIVSVRAQDLR
jgi:hypothetical protein